MKSILKEQFKRVNQCLSILERHQNGHDIHNQSIRVMHALDKLVTARQKVAEENITKSYRGLKVVGL
jgi:hypothetical protein